MSKRPSWWPVRGLSAVARAVRAEGLTDLAPSRLRSLEDAARMVNARAVPGNFVEAGVALGGSGIVLATHALPARRFLGYDVFEQIPPPTDQDPPEAQARYQTIAAGESQGIGGDTYYGYLDDLYDRVAAPSLATRFPSTAEQCPYTADPSPRRSIRPIRSRSPTSIATGTSRLRSACAVFTVCSPREALSSSTTTTIGEDAGGPLTSSSPRWRTCMW